MSDPRQNPGGLHRPGLAKLAAARPDRHTAISSRLIGLEQHLTARTCPSDDQLQAFNDGLVDDETIQQIVRHLGDCERCLDRLEKFPPGPLASGLKNSVQEIKSNDGSASFIFQSSIQPPVEYDNPTPSQPDHLGFDRYVLAGNISEGSFANTFFALDEHQKPVVVKIPLREKLTSPEHCHLFLKDAASWYSVEHPHVMPLLDFGFWQEDLPFAAMQYIEAPNLKKFARTWKLPDESTMSVLFKQICQAVGFAHNQNVSHRHLNPNNVFVAAGPRILVADFCMHYDGRYQFGLFEPVHDPNPFESPESRNNDPKYIDHRCDIFSIGKILKLLLQITAEIDHSRRELWEQIQSKCTHVRRRDRFQEVAEIVTAIQNFQTDGR